MKGSAQMKPKQQFIRISNAHAKVATRRYNFCHNGLINKEVDGNTLHNVSDNYWNHQNLEDFKHRNHALL